MIWLESLSNPFLRYIDIPAVAEIVKRKMNRRVCFFEGGEGGGSRDGKGLSNTD